LDWRNVLERAALTRNCGEKDSWQNIFPYGCSTDPEGVGK
jgi:hypothetical protein